MLYIFWSGIETSFGNRVVKILKNLIRDCVVRSLRLLFVTFVDDLCWSGRYGKRGESSSIKVRARDRPSPLEVEEDLF